MKQKDKAVDFLTYYQVYLLENLLTSKEVIQSKSSKISGREVLRSGEGIIRAGEGMNRAGQNF